MSKQRFLAIFLGIALIGTLAVGLESLELTTKEKAMTVLFVAEANAAKTSVEDEDLIVAVPPGTVDGMFMLSFIAANSAITPPAGWTTLIDQQFNTLFFYAGRRPVLSEPASYEWIVVGNRAGVIITLDKQDPTTPFVVQANFNGQDTVAPGTIAAPGTGPFALTTGMLIRAGFFHNINGGFITAGATISNPGNHTLRSEPIGNNRTQVAVFTDDVEFVGTNIISETISCNNSSGTQNQHGITILIKAGVFPGGVTGMPLQDKSGKIITKAEMLAARALAIRTGVKVKTKFDPRTRR